MSLTLADAQGAIRRAQAYRREAGVGADESLSGLLDAAATLWAREERVLATSMPSLSAERAVAQVA